jgi:hypothetical protein
MGHSPVSHPFRTWQLVNRLVGKRPHFVVGAILNGMLDEQPCRVETQCFGLGLGSGNEWIRGNEDAWKAAALKVGDVMHTA